ncbi:family 10 glycosylhydrolase [Geobacter argillaceus]|uniref:Uncharacterized lipoprotein YddW (UPF0748 family) n=1 Tax=Geobacter argillaceus TaxID=345631 RepID=A0A562VFN0_9BACT|nr:family 10 glycosylhydrolase [Geobacter argillaceus]TWJ16709.1 uncharacterized lipoprotein YddW (UPF0748 family) [Geobacter argillaceus]
MSNRHIMNKALKASLLSLLFIMLLPPLQSAMAVDGILLQKDFKEFLNSPESLEIINSHGSSYERYGNGETALKLTGSSYAELQAPKGLTTESGTISFRFKPLWDITDPSSHSFLTLRWDDNRQSYMAVSYGWWEPEGARRLYFVLSNQDFFAFSIPLEIARDYWTEITVTWKSGTEGYCRIFVDGEFRSEYAVKINTKLVPKSNLFIGSDRGATDQRGRRSDFLIDKLLILNRPMTKLEVLHSFENQSDLVVSMEKKERSWIYQSIKGSKVSRPIIDKSGVPVERRVIFDEDMEWATSRSAADKVIRRVKSAGFNVYVPCVWHGQGAYFPSKRAMVHPGLRWIIDTGYDPLAYLITKAHAEGIEVHPWFTVMRREGTGITNFYDTGSPENAYDVHNEGFRRFIVDLMLEVVERYPVDGINLDYIRSNGICMSPSCVDGYFRATGRSLIHDAPEADAYKDTKGTSSVIAWNREAVMEIVRNFSKRAKELRKGLIVSVDAVPSQFYLLIQGQDSIRWANEGLIDVLYYMEYSKRPDVKAVEEARVKLTNPASLTVLLATYDLMDKTLVPQRSRSRVKTTEGNAAVVFRSGPLLADYVLLGRAIWPKSGIAFYNAKQLSDEQIRELVQTVFDSQARPLWP